MQGLVEYLLFAMVGYNFPCFIESEVSFSFDKSHVPCINEMREL